MITGDHDNIVAIVYDFEFMSEIFIVLLLLLFSLSCIMWFATNDQMIRLVTSG